MSTKKEQAMAYHWKQAMIYWNKGDKYMYAAMMAQYHNWKYGTHK